MLSFKQKFCCNHYKIASKLKITPTRWDSLNDLPCHCISLFKNISSMKPRSISCYRLRRCFATFAYDDPVILKFLVFDPCRAPGSSGAPRKAIGPVSCCSQLPMKAIRQGKSNMRLSARVAYLHFVLVRRVFQIPKLVNCSELGTNPNTAKKRSAEPGGSLFI